MLTSTVSKSRNLGLTTEKTDSTETEIRKLEMTFCIDQKVVRFEITGESKEAVSAEFKVDREKTKSENLPMNNTR